MKIAVHVPVFGRRQAFSIFAEWAHRNDLSPVVCIVSNMQDQLVCENEGFAYVQSPNEPFGVKLQTGLAYARRLDFDALLLMGSDDTLDGLDKYREALDTHDFIACGDCHFQEIGTGRKGYWPGYTNFRKGEPAGAGRCFRRDLLDKLDWDIWTGCPERGADSYQWTRLHTVDHSKKIFFKGDGVILTDYKDKDSRTSFDKLIASIK